MPSSRQHSLCETHDDVYGERIVEGRGQGHGMEDEEKEEEEIDEKELPGHLKLGHEFSFRVTVLQAVGVPSEYSDIFCQFK